MEEILGDQNMKICLIYLDDLIIFSETFEQHLERKDIIFEKLKSANLKLAPEKCKFFKTQINFLGHIFSREGIQTDPSKIETIQKWPTSSNADELRSILAFAGYYRRFVKKFSTVTRPLSKLLPPTSVKKGQKKAKMEWIWTEQDQQVFEKLNRYCRHHLYSHIPILTCHLNCTRMPVLKDLPRRYTRSRMV
jgi:hypothetical protein